MAYRNGLVPGLLEAELLGRRSTYVPTSFTHAFTCQAKHAGVIRVDPDGEPCPPYSIAYNQVANGCKFLTVGDEEGCVSIVDTRSEELPSSLYTDHERAPRAKWLAHNNTIFDMAWAKNDSVLYTASGDQHVGVWDTAVGRLRVYCSGHDGSVKAVCPHSTQPDVFASGSRDGGILLWDLRLPSQWCAPKNRMQMGPVMRIDIATNPGQQYTQLQNGSGSTPGSAGKTHEGRQGSSRGWSGRASAANCRRSVTSLLFVRNEHTMISSSDMDGVAKLWDLRKLTTPTGDITIPAAGGNGSPAPGSTGRGRSSTGRGRAAADRRGGGSEADVDVCWLGFTCPSRSSRPAGITSMALSPAGDMLLLSSIDSCHYLYSLAALDQPPVATFSGHRADSFCIKSCFSPCGRHILSGSSDKRAYIWDVGQPSLPPVALPGHTGEVTAVAWCPSDMCQIATAADDATLRVWSMDRNNTRYQQTYNHCNYLFSDEGRQHGLWDRLGFSKPTKGGQLGAMAAAAAATATPRPESLQDLPGAMMRPAGKLPATAGAGPSGSAATAGGVTAGGKASICSPPNTPQLPVWRGAAADAAGSTPGVVAPAAAAAGVGADACNTPAEQQCVKASPGSATVRNTTPRLRQLKLSEQLSAARTAKLQQELAPVSAPAAPDSNEGLQAAVVDSAAAAPAGQCQEAPATCLTSTQQQQHVGSSTFMDAHPGSKAAAGANRAAADADAAAGSIAGNTRAFEQWMRALTPSPDSQPGKGASQPAATTAPFTGSPRVQQPAALHGSVLPLPASCRRGGLVELSTPWALPSPVRQQRQAEQAALEAERLQQSKRMQGRCLQDTQQRQQRQQQGHERADGQPGSNPAAAAAAAAVGGSAGGSGGGLHRNMRSTGEASSCCRLLQDEFEVYCDDESGALEEAAAGEVADSAGTPVSSSPQENLWKAATQAAAATGAVPGLGELDMAEEEAAHLAMVPCSLPAQDCVMVPASLPPDMAEQSQTAAQQQQQQYASQDQTVQSPDRRHQQHQQPALLQAAGQKPGEVLLGDVGRRPLGDLSKLLPTAAEGPLSPGGNTPRAAAAVAAVGSPGGRVRALCAAHRNSPVRALNMSAAPSSPAAAGAVGAADSPLLLMLQHARFNSQQPQQQQQGVGGLAPRSAQQQQQQQQQQHNPVSPVRHSPVHGDAGRRLSRLGDRHLSPLTFAVHGSHQQHAAWASTPVGVTAMVHDRQAAQQAQPQPQHQAQPLQQQQQHYPACADSEGLAHAAAAAAPAASPAGNVSRSGGIKRSSVPPSTSRKRQCTLADLWTAKPPEVEDGASRFSRY